KKDSLDFNWIRVTEEVLGGNDFTIVSDILVDHNGYVWFSLIIGDYGYLLKFRPSDTASPYIINYQLFQSEGDIQFRETQTMIETTDHEIWVTNSSYKTGINIFDGKSWRNIKLSDFFGGDEYTADIVQSTDGTVWIGSLGKLYAYKDGEWALYNSPQFQIPANKLKLFRSRENKLWISGFKSKAYLLDYSPDRWITYVGLNYQCEVGSDEQWFLDVHGKAISKNGNRWIAWNTEDGLIDAPVTLLSTSKGQVWAAGSHNGVAATAYLHNGRWHKQLHPELSWGIDYRAVFEAKDGSLWFGASVDAEPDKGHLSGVLKLEDPTADDLIWEHFKYHENGLNQSNAYGIGQSPDGRIWLGGGSLLFYNGGSWQQPEMEQLRQFVNIVTSTENQLVVGSRFYGIFIFDGQNWINFNTESGLTNNTIISIDAVSDDCIWVATENDICRFDGERWSNNIFPEEMNMDFEGGNIRHCSDGAIWINKSDRGWKRRAFSHNKTQQRSYKNYITYRYLPDDIPPETEITFFNPEVSPDGNTLIRWEGKDFFGESPVEKLAYSYRINGGAWSPFTNDQHHTFLSLSSGNYKLQVRAMDMGFNVDETPAVVEFWVKPPVWKQGWFISLVSMFLLVIGIFGYNILTKKQKLEKLNKSLKKANWKLQINGEKIKSQNDEILKQQELILAQKNSLELSNQNLEEQNFEIQFQRDKLEEMVVQVEELSKTKLNFFTNISHELRTPLSLILGPLEQLKDFDNTFSEMERKQLLEIVERNSHRLMKLINQLLEMRKIENSSLDLQLKSLNLSEFLSDIVDLFQNLSRKRNIPLIFKTSCKGDVSMLDADKVEKVAVNLLSNAFKHTPDGGKINLYLERVDAVDFDLPLSCQGYYYLSVKDTGEGISKEAIEHIFERYYHTDDISGINESSGIGLSYIKDLVEIHKGVIRVSSTPGKGSQFDVFLPADLEVDAACGDEYIKEKDYQFAHQEINSVLADFQKVAQASTTDFSKIEMLSNRPRILVVEDNLDMITFIEGLLQNEYHVITAENGKEALKIAENHTLDLILSDVMMPEMNGLEFCNKIKTELATSHLPVILITAKSLPDQKVEGYEVGADDYITKPFSPKILQMKVSNILNQKKSLQEKLARDFKLTPQKVNLTSPDEALFTRLVELMEEHIDDSAFNVNKMCEKVHLSHMHFIRKVKQITGKKPADLLKSFRMKRAKDLLLQNKMTIAEVAYSVGFDLPNSFSRAFKKEFGQSPSEFLETFSAGLAEKN
ncbi:MAG: hybrid sensor histidine kinase/response regulator, partial [Bacteroidetes bacterium]